MVPSTSFPMAHTARTFRSRSRAMMSASYPHSNVPSRSRTPMKRAGVSAAILTASSNGISPFCTMVRSKRSMVAMLPASAERSASLQTPSSMMTRGSKASLLSLAAHANASVIRAVFSSHLIFCTRRRIVGGTCIPSATTSTVMSSIR